MKSSMIVVVCISLLFCSSSLAQQPYLNNLQYDCSSNGASTLGYTCNGAETSCSTYLTFRSSAPSYQSPALISYLLKTNASALAELNGGVPDVAPIPAFDLVLVPATCSCSGLYYQHNATYTIKYQGETYLLVANDTYQGLSTCQALIAQNPYDPRNLTVGMELLVPLRCACPTKNQTDLGVKYLLNYLVTPGDTVPSISQRFAADYQSVLQANDLTSDSVIFPYNSLLLPIKTEPTLAEIANPAPPPAAASPPPPPPDHGASGSSNNNNNTGVFVGVGVGAALLILLSGLLSWYFCCFRGRNNNKRRAAAADELPEYSNVYGGGGGSSDVPGKSPSTPFKSKEIRTFLDSLVVYRFDDLEKATGSFAEDNRIGGSAYRGVINGDDAAVKRLKGDVSNEISILKQINHSSVVRLSGLCVHEGNTYLVYEFVERGSLSDWLHHREKGRTDRPVLSWKQRVRIAYDVADGLNYLHHYTSPPYVHKNVKSSNVLLDAEFRGKLANFGLARAVEEYGEGGGLQLTRHVVGTHGYMAPEYLEHGLITPKLDVFAFGVVMLELLSGKEAMYPKDEEEEEEEKGELLLSASLDKVLNGGDQDDARTKLRDFVDPCLRNEYPFDLALAMAELAVRCVAREAGSRPSMTDVLMTLSALYNSTLDWDPSEVRKQDSMVHGR